MSGSKQNVSPKPSQPTRQCEADRLLVLSNIRSSQQSDELKKKIKNSKNYLRGRPFKTRTEPPKFCKKNKIALLSISDKSINQVYVGRLSCNSWTCPDCQMMKALRAKYFVRDVARLNDLSYFVTLTLDPKAIPVDYLNPLFNQTHKYITQIFNHFNTVLKRKTFRYFNKRKNRYFTFKINHQDKALKYIWVIEFHKNGIAHMHVLYNQFLPAEVMRKLWQHVGGGHRIDIQNVRTLDGVSNYVSDYIVKGIKSLEGQGGFNYFERRYSVSRNCIRPKKNTCKNLNFNDSKKLHQLLDKLNLSWVSNELSDINKPDFSASLNNGEVVSLERKHDSN